MSLDITINVQYGFVVMVNGHATEIDIDLSQKMLDVLREKYQEPNRVELPKKEVFYDNITGNLARMADEVEIEPDLTLCDLFWECEDRFGSISCKDLAPKLEIALQILKSDPERFKKFNPKNGWGRYEDLCDVVASTLSACRTFSNGVFSAWG